MDTFDLPRDGETNLAFEGELLALVSTESDRKMRWSEYSIYRTASGKWVVAGVGRSRHPEEDDWFWARVVETPAEVREAFYRVRPETDGVRFLPRSAARLLEEAADADPELDEVTYEWVD